ncbi:MAG: hypothetical protein QOD25_2537, partial [Alphaproteobacteria bacterium]|nr:hypothetical protein [Alphaproteobacteria bacterium]
MLTPDTTTGVSDHPGFRRMFTPGRLTVGVFFPIEAYQAMSQPCASRSASRSGLKSSALPP